MNILFRGPTPAMPIQPEAASPGAARLTRPQGDRVEIRFGAYMASSDGRPLRTPAQEKLIAAVLDQDAAAVRNILKDQTLEPNVQTTQGSTPLILAVNGGHAEIVRMLLADERTDIEYPNSRRMTPLMSAVIFNRPEIAELLIARGANPNFQVEEGQSSTPLMLAISHYKPKMAETLLRHGANPNLQRAGGYTALHDALLMRQTHLVPLLLQYGADPTISMAVNGNALQTARKLKVDHDILGKNLKPAEQQVIPMLQASVTAWRVQKRKAAQAAIQASNQESAS